MLGDIQQQHVDVDDGDECATQHDSLPHHVVQQQCGVQRHSAQHTHDRWQHISVDDRLYGQISKVLMMVIVCRWQYELQHGVLPRRMRGTVSAVCMGLTHNVQPLCRLL